jgi:hypothetical protein
MHQVLTCNNRTFYPQYIYLKMEGPISSWGLRNRLTRLNLHERDDDDDNVFIWEQTVAYSTYIIK